MVSTGKNIQATAARHKTTSNTTSASIWWQLPSKATATRGQTTPPTLPIAVAIPEPVERTYVGYTYEKKGISWQGIPCCKKISTETDKACSESKDPQTNIKEISKGYVSDREGNTV